VLATVQGLFDASQQVKRNEFRLMVTPALTRHPEIMAIQWAPSVKADERIAFEQALQSKELGNQGIYDVSPNASISRKAEARAGYFPVLFSGRQSSTQPFSLVPDPNGSLAEAIYQPIFWLQRPHATPEQRKTDSWSGASRLEQF